MGRVLRPALRRHPGPRPRGHPPRPGPRRLRPRRLGDPRRRPARRRREPARRQPPGRRHPHPQRRRPAARPGPPLAARTTDTQRLRAHRSHRRRHPLGLRPARRSRHRRPHRPALRRQTPVRPGRGAAPGTARRPRRAVHRRRTRPRLPRPARAHRRTLRRLPLPGTRRRPSLGRAHVPDRRPRPLEPAGRHRVPRPHRRPGQTPRLPHRTRRGRGGPRRPPRHRAERRRRPRGRARRPAPGGVRGPRTRPERRPRRTPELAGAAAARLPAALRLRAPGRPAAQRQRQGRPARTAPPGDGHHPGRAPRGAREQLLCDLFAQVLSTGPVGADDGFFDLGGDSILSIQLVNAARRAGLALSTRDLFEHPTPAALAALVPAPAATGGGPDTGDVPLTPVVHRWRELGGPTGTFHQSVAVPVPAGLGLAELTGAVTALLDRHDALRLALTTDPDWRLRVLAPGSLDATRQVRRVDATGAHGTALRDLITREAAEARTRLAPERAEVFQAVWLDRGDEPGRLLLVAHHIAVDAVSWRILLPDLAEAWQAVSDGREPQLAPVPTSLRAWATGLHRLAAEPGRDAELGPWLRRADADLTPVGGRPLDPARDVLGSAGRLELTLPPEVTARVLDATNRLRCDAAELLLTGLVLAVSGWDRDRPGVLVEIEGHGRAESLLPGADLSRTVGWFTSLHPLLLPAGRDLDEVLTAVKERVRDIPDQGIGHGLLRHLTPATGARLARLARPDFAFNYLGRVSAAPGGLWTSTADEGATLDTQDPATPLSHAVALDAVVLDGTDGPRLTATWTWAADLLTPESARALAQGWFTALTDLSGHEGVLTPPDVSAPGITADDLATLRDLHPGLVDVLPLSPLQQGLYFHHVHHGTLDEDYVVQCAADLDGPLDADRFEAAAQALLDRHTNLRAGFRHEGLDRPVQILPGQVPVPWTYTDLTALTPADREGVLEKTARREREQGFSLTRPPLLRFALLRCGPNRHRLLLTLHHILLDGWSTPVLFHDLLHLYRADDPEPLPPVRPFRDHLRWLAGQDRDGAAEAWRTALDGLPGPTLLVPGHTSADPAQAVAELSEEDTAALTGSHANVASPSARSCRPRGRCCSAAWWAAVTSCSE
ncbi:hypothetical protein F3K43_08030 [Streptomyces sp. LBUM 1476]|nr:hypothetical protein [Streptomyces sp. LBUM 1476]